jgi:hypothetical protein
MVHSALKKQSAGPNFRTSNFAILSSTMFPGFSISRPTLRIQAENPASVIWPVTVEVETAINL